MVFVLYYIVEGILQEISKAIQQNLYCFFNMQIKNKIVYYFFFVV